MVAYMSEQQIVFASYLLITILVVIPVSVVLIIALLTFKNWVKWKIEFQIAQRQEWKQTHGPDGNPYPLAQYGRCEQCKKYSRYVFTTHDKLYICKSCYDDQHAEEYINNITTVPS